MNEEEFARLINAKIGYQGYISTTHKPLPQPQPNTNPFGAPSTRPKDLWMLVGVEVGLDTLFGKIKMGSGVSFDLTLADLKKNHPYLFS